MSSSLISALGGLRAHQGWIDVIGNNLANLNTPGFKSSRTSFSDLISSQVRAATPPTGTLGGTNPLQIGLGVKIGHIGRDMSQGSLNLTGRTFDLALTGNGFFSLTDGVSGFYTRVGTFGLDGSSNLVDVRTGLRVADLAGQPIQIDVDSVRAPSPTASLSFVGNLPNNVEGPLAQILASGSALVAGTEAQTTGTVAGPVGVSGTNYTMDLVANGGAPESITVTAGPAGITAQDVVDAINNDPDITGLSAAVVGGFVQITSTKSGEQSTIKVNSGSPEDLAQLMGISTSLVAGTETPADLSTSLNELVTNTNDYVNGDVIEVTGTNSAGVATSGSFVFGTDGTTLGEFVGFVDSLYSDATAEFDLDSGKIKLTANETGESLMSVIITDQAGTTNTVWAQHPFTSEQVGMGADEVVTSTEIYDSAGEAHIVTFRYQRQDDGTWTLFPETADGEGEVLTPELGGIAFGSDGSLLTNPSIPVSIQFNGQGPQEIIIDYGQIGDIDGLTQFGAGGGVVVNSQDGSPAGELATLSVNSEGGVVAFYTNGESESVGQIAIATFTNELGLSSVGDNYYQESPNSGQRRLSLGLSNGAGEVVSGALEDSNVDTAEEFVRLIQAQRGFQANARIITVQDEMFAEVVRII